MRNYSLLKTIPLSFHSKALYRDVGQEWPGLGFGYVLFTLFIISLPIALYFTVLSFTISPEAVSDIDYIVKQVPQMTFNNGELLVDAQLQQPYYVRAPKNNKGENPVLAIIDTTRNVNDWNQTNFRGIIIGKTQALLRSKPTESRLYDYPHSFNYIITEGIAREWVEWSLQWLWVLPWLTLPFLIFPFFLYRIVQLFLYGLFGLIIANFTKTVVSYSQSVRLAAVAITPAIALDIVMSYLLHIHVWALAYFVLAMGYLWFAMKANSDHA